MSGGERAKLRELVVTAHKNAAIEDGEPNSVKALGYKRAKALAESVYDLGYAAGLERAAQVVENFDGDTEHISAQVAYVLAIRAEAKK